MIGPLISVIETIVLTTGIAVSNGVSRSANRRRAVAPRRTIRFTPQASVDRLVSAYRDLREHNAVTEARAARLEAENLELRAELEAARRVFLRRHPNAR